MMMVSNDLPDGLTVKFTPDCQEYVYVSDISKVFLIISYSNKRNKSECTVNVGGVVCIIE
jgi:hypothetical protein